MSIFVSENNFINAEMKKLFLKSILLTFFTLITFYSFSQPIPVELMAGNRYATINVVVDKKFTQSSKLGFFHINTIQVDNRNKLYNDFMMEDLLYFEPIKHFRLTGGAFYGQPGFIPTIGLQYVRGGKDLFLIIAPRVNLQKDLEYDLVSILQYNPQLNDKIKLYSRLQLLNLFNSSNNIKSYQWIRLGLEIHGIQFGVAADFDEYGPHPRVEHNFGLFIRREIL
jgi:hypothetical protein